jgi:preprotein translocase subunit SecD
MFKKKNTIVFIILLAIFAVAALVALPLDQGIIGGKGIRLGLDLQGGTHLVYQADFSNLPAADQSSALDGVIAVLTNRINPMGVAESQISKQGSDRIVVDLPGKSFTDKEKESLAQVAILEFGVQAASGETAKWTVDGVGWKPATGTVNGQTLELSSSYFNNNTYVSQSDTGQIALQFEWNDIGSQLSTQITGAMIGQPLGIFEGNEPLRGQDGRQIAPTVQSQISTRGQIEGLNVIEARTLSSQLNAGRLPVPLTKIYDQTVSPILGSDFVDLSLRAAIVGLILVMVFMTSYYRFPGFLASITLLFYAVVNLALFKLFNVTLTLAGIGGFVVAIGMAVDANVIIFERLKEELNGGRTLGAAVEAGFSRAWLAIRDSNITTIVACIILYWVGNAVASGANVKGFALTLLIGVIVSMFSALIVTRSFMRLSVGTGLARNISLFRVTGRKQQ